MLYAHELHRGMHVRFTGAGGYDMQLEKAHQLLQPDHVYVVSDVFCDSWASYIYLEGIPRLSFATSMFVTAGSEPPTPVHSPGTVRKVRPPVSKT